VNNPWGVSLYNFVNSKSFIVSAPAGPTYWLSSTRKNLNILDTFVAKYLNNLFYTTNNILDLNSAHSSVFLTLNTTPTNKESFQLFNKCTDRPKFHDLVNEEIKLNIKLKTDIHI